MKVVALISGGKDSCFNMMHCVANGHEIVALANLKPAAATGKDELDSYMYQTVGHDAIELYRDCMNLPLFRREIRGEARAQGADYRPTVDDEVEDLYELLSAVKAAIPDVEGVASGAILSNYQRVRVENVCSRLGLTSFAYLWRRDQKQLLEEMIESGLDAVLIKVAAMGLKRNHLGKTLNEMYPHLLQMHERFDAHICGEGGEFESFTRDCPLFVKRIILDEVETVIHSDDAVAVVAYLRIKKAHVEDKAPEDIGLTEEQRAMLLSNGRTTNTDCPSKEVASLMVQEMSSDLLVDKEQSATPLRCRPENRWRPPYFTIPGIQVQNVTPNKAQGTLEEETTIILDYLQGQLVSCGLTWDNVVMMHVYVRDMSAFGRLNAAYNRYFGLNPPPRVTVEVALPGDSQVQIDCLAYQYADPAHRKETLHVQSVSYWAPANIGPYSQAAMVSDHIYVAGQIGLIPNTMQLPSATSVDPTRRIMAGLMEEITTSLRSLERIVVALSADVARDAAACVCYVTDARFGLVARKIWEERVGPQVPAVFVTVPGLPRNAKVEWQVLFGNRSARRSLVDEYHEEPVIEVLERYLQAQSSVDADICWEVQSWHRGNLGCVVGTCGQRDLSTPLTQSILTTAWRTLLASLSEILDGVSERTLGVKEVISIRVFYHCNIPLAWIEKAVKWETASGQGDFITFVPVSNINASLSALAVSVHASRSSPEV
ncbi:TIGR00289 family protein [Spizellomyces punctatus DAOM BR117]|uniref:Diphthine--ammonia ligase n=1 Tax=Spizellomyces punctatus (strain DAOM BR117) TaxID=645134 RepID=A0A0L0HM09_SPIPD|nr:TIGR00289 family protein [Spizellomyces punctatus DAOM BR117]KND01955.1 TIGR00289 family protein [Spizellomyces punctatus DAOM BR117]|eukprot:XP_016609994.1 TIGR00289 family protein [Spizellomyces punctatus DAOM BR117]